MSPVARENAFCTASACPQSVRLTRRNLASANVNSSMMSRDPSVEPPSAMSTSKFA
jgi:hypothetical protein